MPEAHVVHLTFGPRGSMVSATLPVVAGPNGRVPSSQTPEKIQQVLLLGLPKRMESRDHGVGFRRRELGSARTGVRLNRLDEVGRTAIVHQENPLAEPPEGRRPKLVTLGDPLGDAVGQPRPHSMQEQVREQSGGFLAQRRC